MFERRGHAYGRRGLAPCRVCRTSFGPIGVLEHLDETRFTTPILTHFVTRRAGPRRKNPLFAKLRCSKTHRVCACGLEFHNSKTQGLGLWGIGDGSWSGWGDVASAGGCWPLAGGG